MRYERFETRRFLPVVLGVALVAGLGLGQTNAAAAQDQLNLLFVQQTGLGNFDIVLPGQVAQPGQDTSADDEIIRTNDIVTYQFTAGMPEDSTQTVKSPWIEFTLPVGEQFVDLIDGVPSYTDVKGNYNVVAPAFCGAGSEITYTGGATTMPAPDHQNLTSTSWQELPRQTLKCYLDDITPGQGIGLTLYSKVRPEVPNGTLFSDISITIHGDAIDPQPTEALQHTVTSGSKWDLSFNGSLPIGDGDNSDFVKQDTEQMCAHNYARGTGTWQGQATGNAGQLCYNGGFTVTLAQPNAGLGGTAIQDGEFTYTLDLSPEAIWSQPTAPGGPSIWQAVQDYNAANPADQIELPGGYTTQNFGGTGWTFMSANSDLLPTGTPAVNNSVRTSGQTTLTAYVPEQTATFTVTGADTTAYTIPKYAGLPENFPLWDQRGYVYTSRVFIEVPLTVIEQHFEFFDRIDAGGLDGEVDLPIHFVQNQSELSYTSVAGLSEVATNSYTDTDDAENNYRTMQTGFVNRIAVRNQWTSPFATGDDGSTPTFTEGPSTATSPVRYWSGNPGMYGPPGEAAIYKGDGVSVDGQPMLSALILEGRSYNGGGTLMCQSFDNREVVVDPAVAMATDAGSLQVQHIAPTRFPGYSDVDNGGATWIYGSMYQYVGATQEAATGNMASQAGMGDRYTEFTVRYGVGDPTDKNCLAPIDWYTAEQINADPTLDWADVNKVEVYLESMPGGNVAEFRTNVSIGMRVLDNDPATLIETNVNRTQQWFSPRLGQIGGTGAYGASLTAQDLRDAVYTADGNEWTLMSSYDEVANNAGESTTARLGDRLTHVDMMARIDKQVQSHLDDRPFVSTDLWVPEDSTHVATQPNATTDIDGEYTDITAPPIYGPESQFTYRLTPTLDANPMPPSVVRDADNNVIQGFERDVLVEDCLPVSIRPRWQAGDNVVPGWTMYIGEETKPYLKTPMVCEPGETYIGLWKQQVDVTMPLEPIELPVYALGTAMSGLRVNQAEISLMDGFASQTSDADPSLFTQRADRARVQIQAPDGLRVAKSTLNPVVFVDELLYASTPTVTWEIQARNINSGVPISNVDIIDYLPADGVNETHYYGDRGFLGTRIESGTNLQIYYTKATLGGQSLAQWSDPASASNQAGGSTVWCSDYTGAADATTHPVGGDIAQCPQSAAEVTGIRVFRPGNFPNGDFFKVDVVVSAEGRVLPDTAKTESIIMNNEVVMRADGLDTPLYSDASSIWVHREVPPNPGTISGAVWDDYNRNGEWDEGEPPLAGVLVSATVSSPIWCPAKWDHLDNDDFRCWPVTLQAITRDDGSYDILNVYPGWPLDLGDVFGPREPYVVTFTTPDGYEATVPGRSLAPETEAELNVENQYIKGIDAGYFKPAELGIAKAVVDADTGEPVSAVRAGQQLTYTVTATNLSDVRYLLDSHPGTFVDDLADVLDDATLVAGPTNSSGAVERVGDQIVWTGALDPGAQATVSYTVEVAEGGDLMATNLAFVTSDPIDPDTGLPTDPETGEPTPTPGVDDCVEPGCATTSTPIAELAVTKAVTMNTDQARPGTELSYAVTLSNVGEGDFTAEMPAAFVDDLAGVLDDGTLGTVTASVGAVEQVGERLVWSGALASGDSVTINYTVVVSGAGDQLATNVAFITDDPLAPTPGVDDCVEPQCATTTTPIAELQVTKAVSADTEQVMPGTVLTYTVTATNAGKGDFTATDPAVLLDDLTGVLDDGTLGSVTASAGTVEQVGERLVWSGALASGESATISYQLTVTDGGDLAVTNVVFVTDDPVDPGTGLPTDPQTGEPTPTPAVEDCVEPTCATTTTTVVVPEPRLHIAKTVSASADPVVPGTVLSYTVTGSNVGQGDFTVEMPATLVDDLAAVLDDGTLGAVTASVGTVEQVGDKLVWSGALAGGEAVTISYQVKLTDAGDKRAVNVAFVTGDPIDPDTGLPTDPVTGQPTPTPAVDQCDAPTCATTSTQVVVPQLEPPTPVKPQPKPSVLPKTGSTGNR